MNVLLGVGGGIAAYKAAELCRALQERGATVQVVMTSAAQEFIQPLTFAALTGRKVITGLFDHSSPEAVLSSSVEHIAVARDNALMVVAPATADLLARFAHGLAGDFLTTTYLAFTGPVVLAPAMNSEMWRHPANAANVATLRSRARHHFVDPADGYLACGEIGPGRLADPAVIAEAVMQVAHPRRDLAGEVVLITAGPTQEPIDPVRYITNRSSGKMGYAIAEAAAARGARVMLVSGPVNIAAPRGVEVVPVRTAREMLTAVMARVDEATIVIKSAAVADYTIAEPAAQKVKKTAARFSLDLDPTTDILAEVGKRKGDRLLIGFAAETNDLIGYARKKLTGKNCDMVVANLVNQAGTGFESDVNEITLVLKTGENIALPLAPKRELADRIFDQALLLRLALHA
jgi:phosphopantothenoylcysteine decarboxylase / phosphopantothenate---cysteine ligase